MTITYTLQSGSLPAGLSLESSTGKITGDIDFANLGLGPIWINPPPGNLPDINAGELIAPVQLDVDSEEPFTYAVSRGYLPLGVTLDFDSGVISGTFPDIPGFVTQDDLNRGGPQWTTPSGRVGGDIIPGDVVNTSLTATPLGTKTIDRYSTVGGGLPWGLTLNGSTGEITGTVLPLLAPGFTVEVPKLPEPVWNTSSGSLTTLDEYQTTPTINLSATPAAGRTISQYRVVSGNLPWGLSLGLTTGEITGTTHELTTVSSPVFVDPTFNPIISDTVSVNGVNQTVVNAGSLGSFNRGTSMTINFDITTVAPRNIGRVVVLSGSLPWGLVINPLTGSITGNLREDFLGFAGVYNFTIGVYDNGPNGGNLTTRSYSLTISTRPEDSLPHRYWRLLIFSNHWLVNGLSTIQQNFTSLAELVFMPTINGTNLGLGLTTGIASSFYLNNATNRPNVVFDGNPSTWWANDGDSVPLPSNPAWIGLDFVTPVLVGAVGLRARNDGGQGQLPLNYSIQWSDDNSNWFTLWNQTDTNGVVVSGEFRQFSNPFSQ